MENKVADTRHSFILPYTSVGQILRPHVSPVVVVVAVAVAAVAVAASVAKLPPRLFGDLAVIVVVRVFGTVVVPLLPGAVREHVEHHRGLLVPGRARVVQPSSGIPRHRLGDVLAAKKVLEEWHLLPKDQK